jgi:hypothetical protein
VPFDIFWIKKSGKKTKVISHGSILSPSELERWTKREINLEFCYPHNLNTLEVGFSFLEELLNISKSSSEYIFQFPRWRRNFIDWILKSSEDDETSVSVFEVSGLFAFWFGDISPELKKQFYKFPEKVQSKNLASASLSIILAMVAGYSDYSFLRELYTTLLFMDYPLSQKIFSETDNAELVTLMNKSEPYRVPKKIVRIYKEYMNEGIKFLRENLQNKSLAYYLEWSFESFNGKGFLKNVNANELSDLDSIVVGCHSLFRFETIEYERSKTVLDLVRKLKGTSYDTNKRLVALLGSIESKPERDEDSEYLEIVGL